MNDKTTVHSQYTRIGRGERWRKMEKIQNKEFARQPIPYHTLGRTTQRYHIIVIDDSSMQSLSIQHTAKPLLHICVVCVWHESVSVMSVSTSASIFLFFSLPSSCISFTLSHVRMIIVFCAFSTVCQYEQSLWVASCVYTSSSTITQTTTTTTQSWIDEDRIHFSRVVHLLYALPTEDHGATHTLTPRRNMKESYGCGTMYVHIIHTLHLCCVYTPFQSSYTRPMDGWCSIRRFVSFYISSF